MFHRPVITSVETEARSQAFELASSGYWHSIISESVIGGLVGVMDGLIIALVGGMLYWTYVGWSPETYPMYLAMTAVNAALTVAGLQYCRFYDFETLIAWPSHMRRAIALCALVFLVPLALVFALKISEEFSRIWFFSSFLASAFAICMYRGLVRYFIVRSARAGLLARNVAIVGASGQAHCLVTELRRRDVPWKHFVGVFDDRKTRIEHKINGLPVLGDLDDLVRYVRGGLVHDVVITLPWNADDRLVSIIDRLRCLPVHVYLGSDLIGYHFPRHHRRHLEGVPVLEIASVPLAGWAGLVKAAEDKILAVLALLVMSPLLLLIALAIKLDSRGPVLFRQARYGFNNEVIIVNKFRTMVHDRPPEAGVPQARRGDPRVTRVGRLLRRLSFDELPQVLNVLDGQHVDGGPEAARGGTQRAVRGADRRLSRPPPGEAGDHRLGAGQRSAGRDRDGGPDAPARGVRRLLHRKLVAMARSPHHRPHGGLRLGSEKRLLNPTPANGYLSCRTLPEQ